jgi:hypothetical protein
MMALARKIFAGFTDILQKFFLLSFQFNDALAGMGDGIQLAMSFPGKIKDILNCSQTRFAVLAL